MYIMHLSIYLFPYFWRTCLYICLVYFISAATQAMRIGNMNNSLQTGSSGQSRSILSASSCTRQCEKVHAAPE